MWQITRNFHFDASELELSFIRSPGPGGQNVNKVASGVLLRFNVMNSRCLPEMVRARLMSGNRVTQDGDLIIKATRFRTQERNKQDAFERLYAILKQAASIPKKRRKTKPTFASSQKRLTQKKRHSKTKSLRGKKELE